MLKENIVKVLESIKDKYLQEDLEFIANSNIPLDEFYNKTILITGATGLIGSQIVKALLCINRIKNTKINIIALVRDTKKVNIIFNDVKDNKNLKFIFSDVTKKLFIEDNIDYIIHTASATASKFFVEHPVETIDIAINGTKNILELAKEKNISGMVYLSSMEAFGITDPNLESVSENDLGYIDIHNIRSCYSESKRMIECMCSCYAFQYNIPIKIARLSQVFGAGVSLNENRIFAQFAKSVINGEDIILHTHGKSYGNYCYTRDAIIAIFILLIYGNSGEAYTIANEKSNIKIRDMAYMVADKIANGNIKVKFDIPKDSMQYGYAPDVKMKLNASKMRSLGWEPKVGLEEAYRRMICSMLVQKTID